MRRVVLALLVLAAAVPTALVGVGGSVPSYAAGGSDCSAFSGQHLPASARHRLDRLTQRVADVFEGSVTLPQHVNPDKPLTLTVHVLAAWKGISAPTRVKVTLEPGACREWTLAHRSPEDYLFLVSPDARTHRLTAVGDAPRVLAHTAAIEKVLGSTVQGGGSRSGGQKVTFDRVGAASPHSFRRLAAPGAALALVGVLGLLVVGRLARRA
jgi:hypothetical protein